MAERHANALETGGGTPFARLDAVLAGAGPRSNPEGLRYEDPTALYEAEMARVRREGLVH